MFVLLGSVALFACLKSIAILRERRVLAISFSLYVEEVAPSFEPFSRVVRRKFPDQKPQTSSFSAIQKHLKMKKGMLGRNRFT